MGVRGACPRSAHRTVHRHRRKTSDRLQVLRIRRKGSVRPGPSGPRTRAPVDIARPRLEAGFLSYQRRGPSSANLAFPNDQGRGNVGRGIQLRPRRSVRHPRQTHVRRDDVLPRLRPRSILTGFAGSATWFLLVERSSSRSRNNVVHASRVVDMDQQRRRRPRRLRRLLIFDVASRAASTFRQTTRHTLVRLKSQFNHVSLKHATARTGVEIASPIEQKCYRTRKGRSMPVFPVKRRNSPPV